MVSSWNGPHRLEISLALARGRGAAAFLSSVGSSLGSAIVAGIALQSRAVAIAEVRFRKPQTFRRPLHGRGRGSVAVAGVMP